MQRLSSGEGEVVRGVAHHIEHGDGQLDVLTGSNGFFHMGRGGEIGDPPYTFTKSIYYTNRLTDSQSSKRAGVDTVAVESSLFILRANDVLVPPVEAPAQAKGGGILARLFGHRESVHELPRETVRMPLLNEFGTRAITWQYWLGVPEGLRDGERIDGEKQPNEFDRSILSLHYPLAVTVEELGEYGEEFQKLVGEKPAVARLLASYVLNLVTERAKTNPANWGDEVSVPTYSWSRFPEEFGMRILCVDEAAAKRYPPVENRVVTAGNAVADFE